MIDLLLRAAKSAGKILLKYFDRQIQIIPKGDSSNFCTIADLESEKELLRILGDSRHFKFNFRTEESGDIDNRSDYTVVIDPLDGTNNFKLWIPNFTINLAVLHKEELVASMTYVPLLDQVFHAERWRWAYKEMKVSL